MAIKLYADPITVNCRKALAGLDLMGAEFERVHVDDFTGEHRGEAYRKLNPNASVPTLATAPDVIDIALTVQQVPPTSRRKNIRRRIMPASAARQR